MSDRTVRLPGVLGGDDSELCADAASEYQRPWTVEDFQEVIESDDPYEAADTLWAVSKQEREQALSLRPHESLALTVALARLHRGEDVMPDVATVCIFALGRITGRVGYDAAQVKYRVYPAGDQS